MNSRNPGPLRVWRGLRPAARGCISGLPAAVSAVFHFAHFRCKKGSKSFSSPTSLVTRCSQSSQMSAVETGQMSAAETGQMSAAETGQMSAVETRQMSTIETGLCPVSVPYICLVSTADICPVSAADISPVSTTNICPVSTEDITAAGRRPAAVQSSVETG